VWNITVQARWHLAPETLLLKDVKELIGAYPKIQSKFVQDLKTYAKQQSNYIIESAIREVHTPFDMQVEPENWLLVWGIDSEGRPYYLLIEKEQAGYFLSGAGPDDFAEFLVQTGKDAVGPILALLASPKKMRALMVFVSFQQPPALKQAELAKTKSQFLEWAQTQQNLPNVDGQWFPTFAPKCPICNSVLVGLEGYEVGFGQLICPRCGYKQGK